MARAGESSEVYVYSSNQNSFRHSITRVGRLYQIETGGGILTDEMGMGKTSSVLALILRTLAFAHSWSVHAEPAGFFEHHGAYARRRSRATAVVASSDRMFPEPCGRPIVLPL
ncbi:uncharacterized protein M421DRAFT_415980 [Didymella exigua CBS 183.55]|uniref:Uncharacterized protein n=1 Tax=Didymella exigua CBS 183.55 TaxID=1150837 RepID=A0A6A5S2I3_9PLEO|nr:uncharacterized protein M421DRAFT_415980 [Didymella exigua CBS 183.55]KAF1933634.1 hypothetical protein M421DRAFT_415980 [Didymella exigua CBS 183.55]